MITDGFRQDVKFDRKTGNNIVTKVDKESQDLIVRCQE
jgi:hypothetical protein